MKTSILRTYTLGLIALLFSVSAIAQKKKVVENPYAEEARNLVIDGNDYASEDAFAKAGTGTGKTFTFDFLPLRIDFVLADPVFEVTQFKNYEIYLSDHEPIMASFTLPE